jgi:hypothetical protein
MEKAFYDLLSVRLIRPACDRLVDGKTNTFSFDGTCSALSRAITSTFTSTNQVWDRNQMHSTMPLKLTIDVYSDLQIALDYDLFRCATALLEWGKTLH